MLLQGYSSFLEPVMTLPRCLFCELPAVVSAAWYVRSRCFAVACLIVFVILPLVQGTELLMAQTEINVRGSGKLFPIAVPRMCLQMGQSDVNRLIPEVIARDLDLSGYFEMISPQAYIESPGKCAGAEGFAYSDWSVIGAEGLVRGIITEQAGQIRAQLYLHDVQRQRVVLGKEYAGDVSQGRKIAHRFANEIMRFFTGEPGVFGTRIAFTSKIGRFKELFVMDMDGSQVRQLTDDKGLAMGAAWDAAGKNLLYTTYKNRLPDLFMLNVDSRRVTQISRGPAMEISPKFTPDGRSILVSRSQGDDSDLVMLGMDGTILRKLTPSNGAIDVSPAYSPDGSKVVFVSNRGGGPQIYVMGADGSSPQRISFVSSSYCTSPSWSPKGDRIAFVCRADIGFQIFTMNPDGSQPLQLTSSGDNEDPDFSPDGRYIVYSTTFGHGAGNFGLSLMRSDGSGMKELYRSRGGDTEPAWGPIEE
ncbi:MAG: hypothetical protein EBZ48_03730 [Proteobacteria bacterium]|nr:hypothetical protein [Pseudomonadota bacterium]